MLDPKSDPKPTSELFPKHPLTLADGNVSLGSAAVGAALSSEENQRAPKDTKDECAGLHVQKKDRNLKVYGESSSQKTSILSDVTTFVGAAANLGPHY